MGIFVVWWPRTRGYLSDQTASRNMSNINKAKIFDTQYEAERAAEKYGFPDPPHGQKREPFVIDECGLRRLSGDDD